MLRTTLLLLCLTSAFAAGPEPDPSRSAPQGQPPSINIDQPRSVNSEAPKDVRGSLTIMTWNIDRGTELPAITAGIQANPADVILLQEVDWNTQRSGFKDEAAALAHTLHESGVYAIEFEELSQEKDKSQPAFIGQATLTTLPIRGSRVLRFQHQSSFWQPRSWLPSNLPLMQRRAGSRIALVTELTYAGNLLVVYNAHLESRNYGKLQSQQMDEIFDDTKQYPSGTAFLVGGDLNTKYFPSVFLRKFQNAGYVSAMGDRTPRTHNIPACLDWLLVKGPVHIAEGEVRKNLKGSDHYAVYAAIRAQ